MTNISKQFARLLFVSFTALFCAGNAAAIDLGTPAAPDIAARSYILVDFASGRVIASGKAEERMEPASLTKIMTSYVVLNELKAGKAKLDDQVLISEKAWRTEGSRSFVEVGKQIPLEILLKGMIVQSGNDATVALAEHLAGSEEVFAGVMNQTAKKLGMSGSHFMNSTGLPDPEHYTTAKDMAILTRALIRNFPEHYDWYSIREFTYNGITQHNRNKLLWQNSNADGVKTGHTESAGYCLVASAKENGMRLISVVLGTDSENTRARESQKLLGYGFRFFESRRLYAPNEALTQARIWKGESETLPLGLDKEMHVVIPRGQYDKLNAAVKIQPNITAPVSKGQKLGLVEVSLNGKQVASQPLVALQEIPEGGFFSRLIDDVKLMFE